MLAPEKTKLLSFSAPRHKATIDYIELVSDIAIAGVPVQFSTTADHVGIVRSCDTSNVPHILDRISGHRKALFAVLPARLARRHNSRYMSGTTPFLNVEYLVFNKNIFFFFFS